MGGSGASVDTDTGYTQWYLRIMLLKLYIHFHIPSLHNIKKQSSFLSIVDFATILIVIMDFNFGIQLFVFYSSF